MKKSYLLREIIISIIILTGVFLFFELLLCQQAPVVVTRGKEASPFSPNKDKNKDKVEKLASAIANEVKLMFHPPLPLLSSE